MPHYPISAGPNTDAHSMTLDEQHASSNAHSNAVVVLYPLKSGAIGVYNGRRELLTIISGEALTSDFVRNISPTLEAMVESSVRAEYKRLGAEILAADGSELPLNEIRTPARKATSQGSKAVVEIEL